MNTPRSPLAVNLLQLSKQLISEVLNPGDTAVDATVGNGHDTLFLSQAVGPQGLVHGFDVQRTALDSAQKLLAEHAADNVQLHHTGHEEMFSIISEEDRQKLKAVMFNLGWLPGGDKSITTAPQTTMAALEALTKSMPVGGVVSVVIYTGHPGGGEEGKAVLSFCEALPFQEWAVFRAEYLNKSGKEVLLFLSRR